MRMVTYHELAKKSSGRNRDRNCTTQQQRKLSASKDDLSQNLGKEPWREPQESESTGIASCDHLGSAQLELEVAHGQFVKQKRQASHRLRPGQNRLGLAIGIGREGTNNTTHSLPSNHLQPFAAIRSLAGPQSSPHIVAFKRPHHANDRTIVPKHHQDIADRTRPIACDVARHVQIK